MLENKKPVPCEDLLRWAMWFEDTPNRRVAFDTNGKFNVSTVFLGLDHSFGTDDGPVLFETMVFQSGKTKPLECRRYSTWQAAENGHAEITKIFFLNSDLISSVITENKKRGHQPPALFHKFS